MLLPQECALTQRAGEDCPNVIKFFDGKIFELEGARMVMMALQRPESSSTDLETFVKRQGQGGLSERVARFIFRQLDLAVHHCHVKGIRHGDITPQNVLLELATGRVFLIDFGKAKEFSLANDRDSVKEGEYSKRVPVSTLTVGMKSFFFFKKRLRACSLFC